jgi:hypothetical protein
MGEESSWLVSSVTLARNPPWQCNEGDGPDGAPRNSSRHGASVWRSDEGFPPPGPGPHFYTAGRENGSKK